MARENRLKRGNGNDSVTTIAKIHTDKEFFEH